MQARNLDGCTNSWEHSVEPFVVIKSGKELHQTTSVETGLNCVSWHEKFTLPLSQAAETLTIEVYSTKESFFSMFADQETQMSVQLVGRLILPVKMLCKSTQPVYDQWHSLSDTTSGELHISTYYILDPNHLPDGCSTANEWLKRNHDLATAEFDPYGFAIPPHCYLEWKSFKTYLDCRQSSQMKRWEEFLRSPGDERWNRLVQDGIPQELRERLYMELSGANAKKEAECVSYYADLTELCDTLTSKDATQIELDVKRTFGHSRTKVSTKDGRDALRRILRAYSVRNPTIGYCQGLNFIAGFLLLVLQEENVFWVLASICEDLFPGYYTARMLDTQIDMMVLKELIADHLPALEAHTESIQVPLELIGSQWLLCLFTTTFPAETALRILDCILLKGSEFVFAIILSHLRAQQTKLLEQSDFHSIITHLKQVEAAMFDADGLIQMAMTEFEHCTNPERIQKLRDIYRVQVEDERERAKQVRHMQAQLAIVRKLPAFSQYASQMFRYFHEEAASCSRTEVAFVLTMICHGIVWFAEKTKRNN